MMVMVFRGGLRKGEELDVIKCVLISLLTVCGLKWIQLFGEFSKFGWFFCKPLNPDRKFFTY
jgi:hypothetical protein